MDKSWSRYLAEITDIREGIHLNRIGGLDPLFEFQKLSIRIFDKVQRDVELDTIQTFNKLKIKDNEFCLDDAGLKAPSSTWTYLINDNPFENMLSVQLMGNIGLSIGAGIWGPLMAVYLLIKKFGRKPKIYQ